MADPAIMAPQNDPEMTPEAMEEWKSKSLTGFDLEFTKVDVVELFELTQVRPLARSVPWSLCGSLGGAWRAGGQLSRHPAAARRVLQGHRHDHQRCGYAAAAGPGRSPP